MQNVLIVASLLTGQGPTGVETHVNQLLAQARQRGIDARFVSAQANKDWRRKACGLVGRVLRRISPEVAVRYLRDADSNHLERQLRRLLAQLGGRKITLYAQDPLSARAVLRSRGPWSLRVVMTAHFNISEASEMAAKGLTCEGGPLWRHAMKTESEVLSRLDRLIFVSDFMRDCVLRRRPECGSRATSVIPNFCDRPDQQAAMQDFDGDLIAIGTLEPRKNQGFLLQVLACCNQRGHRYTLTLVGPGPDAQRLSDQATRLGVAGQVRFMGFQPQAARFLARHRVLVHGARMESQGIALVEAMAFGRPVMAGAVGGIPEVMEHGVQGFHWPLDAPEEAAGQLITLLETPGLWQQVSDAARQRYEERFAPELLVPRWLEAIMGSEYEETT